MLPACPPLTAPTNGMINCELGDDGVPSLGDICSYTCSGGLLLFGSAARTCQSNGSWSGSEVNCRGKLNVYALKVHVLCRYSHAAIV